MLILWDIYATFIVVNYIFCLWSHPVLVMDAHLNAVPAMWHALTSQLSIVIQVLVSSHARCQELGLPQDICHPPPSLREVPSRPGVETHWYVMADCETVVPWEGHNLRVVWVNTCFCVVSQGLSFSYIGVGCNGIDCWKIDFEMSKLKYAKKKTPKARYLYYDCGTRWLKWQSWTHDLSFRRVWLEEQARSVEGQVHPGKDS